MTTFQYPVPPGHTWTDETGRLWTSSGNVILEIDALPLASPFTVTQIEQTIYVLAWELEAGDTQDVRLSQTTPSPTVEVGEFPHTTQTMVVQSFAAVGETLEWSLWGITSQEMDITSILVADLSDTSPLTYGKVDFLATAARYTTVAAVKERLAIEPTDVTRDADILSAIIAAELALDIFMHRSFPDTGGNPQIPGIPDGIRQAALQTAIATWKEADSPTGSSGSDAFMGALSVSETTRTMIQQSAVLIGFRVAFGVA